MLPCVQLPLVSSLLSKRNNKRRNMKLDKIMMMVLGGALLTTSCNDLNHQDAEVGSLSTNQLQQTNEAIPSRVEATFSGMFNYLGKPGSYSTTSGRADDFGAISAALSLDAEGADLILGDNGYNWFSVACELSSRNANYANPLMRYTIPYRQIGVANQIIASYPENTTDENALHQIAQARAIRAYDYLQLAPYFQFSYSTSADLPCVPLLSDSVDAANNPRATVKAVYAQIISDLDYAIEHLDGFKRTSKQYIDQNVAYGLRARANLNMGNFAEAAADAQKAMNGYTPATIAEVSVPTFVDIEEHNWIWGFDVTETQLQASSNGGYQTASSWFSAFSGDGYAAATGNVPMINRLLFDKIPTTDVRRGWWLDANRHSPNWANITWADAKGDAIADLVIDGNKEPFEAYFNIKFGQKSGIGNTLNVNDWPLMRVEEMILIQAEGLARSGNESQAKTVLENFVKTYRDPSYSVTAGGRTLLDEIWFQRRVELWGEGFFTGDAKRLGKNIVRIHSNVESNYPDAFQFNISATDGWLNLRFPQRELDNNSAIVDNTGGAQPVAGQNPELRDGVTD
jgi:hypothetical protein